MFSPRRVSRYKALRMFRAWTCMYLKTNKDPLNMPDSTHIFLLEIKCVCVHLWHRAALSISIIRGHSQCCQRSHGHLQESTAGWFGLRGQQGLQRDNFHLQRKINTQVRFPHIWHDLEWHEAEKRMTEASILGELSFKLYFRQHIPLWRGQWMTAWQRKNDSQCVIEYGLCSFVLVPKGVNSIAQDHLFPGHTAGMCAHARCWVYPSSPCLILPKALSLSCVSDPKPIFSLTSVFSYSDLPEDCPLGMISIIKIIWNQLLICRCSSNTNETKSWQWESSEIVRLLLICVSIIVLEVLCN